MSLVACDKKKTDTVPAAAEATTAAQAVAPVAPLTEHDAEEVFRGWVDAQNTGDFEKYSALYAPKFEGVKRVGAKTSRFDRKAWLEDRGRMFQKGQQVSAEEPKFVVSGDTAVVRFTQRWETKTFADVGPKVLVVAKSPSGVQIVREEMLKSNVLSARERELDANRWAPVVLEEFVVLDDQIKPEWLLDTHRLVGEQPMIGALAVAETWVDVAKLPVTFKTLKARTFTVQGTQECRATVQGFRVLARVTPHFGMVQDWQERPSTKTSAHEIAAEIVALAGDQRVLVAKLDKACPGAIWAHSIADSSLEVFTQEQAETPPVDVMEVIRKTPAFDAIEKQAREFGRDGWFPSEGTMKRFTAGKRVYGVIATKVGEGCGNFYAEYSAVLDISGEPKLLYDNSMGPFLDVQSIVASNNGVAFFGTDHEATLKGDQLDVVLSWAAPYLDCPC
ncbi:MAG: nuclear transport factor 2 family protein [bacterium]